MALVKCPECGREISDKAASCPHCGNPMNALFEKPHDDAEAARIEELERYVTLARRARDDGNDENAAKYYDMVLQKNPFSWEASFFQVYHTAMGCKIMNISSAAHSVSNCLGGVFQLIVEHEEDDKQDAAFKEVINYSSRIATLLSTAAQNHYSNNSTVSSAFDECASRVVAAKDIYASLVSAAQKNIPGRDDIISECAENEIRYINSNMRWFNKSWASGEFKRLEPLVQKTKPNYSAPYVDTTPPAPAKSGGCYVATCVYGSYDCPEVWTLRRYRDDTLAETWYGRAFIRAYYAVSPTIVKWFGDTDWFKRMWRGKLDGMVRDLRAKGVEDTPYEDREW